MDLNEAREFFSKTSRAANWAGIGEKSRQALRAKQIASGIYACAITVFLLVFTRP